MSASDAFFLDNSATVPTGSKRKSDDDENFSSSNIKKSRVMHITQEPSQTPVAIPPQLQDLQARPQLSLQIPNQQVLQGGFEIPPELAAIHIGLNGLDSIPVIPSLQLPPCGPLLTTVVAREDVEKIERRLYPYLWFPGRPPYQLQPQDYYNILGQPHAVAMKKALQRVGMDCGTLALTASHQLVLFFQGEDKKTAWDALAKSMGPNYCQGARWQGATEIPGQNNVVFWGQNIQQDDYGGSGSNTSQSNTWNHHTGQHPQNDPSLYAPPNDSPPQQTLEATTVPPQSQATASHCDPSVDSQASSNSAVAESSTSSRKKNATTRQPAQNRNTFVHVSDDTAKRRRNGPPGIGPIPLPLPDSTNTVSGPSTSYPTNTIFAQTHTTESFPHPQNTNATAVSGPKRKPRGRASAKSRAQDQTPTTVPQQSQLEPVTQKPKAQRGKRRAKKTQDSEPSQFEAGPSGTRVPEPIVPEAQPVHSVTGYGTGGATTGHTLASQPEDQVVNVEMGDVARFSQFFAAFNTNESQVSVQAPYPDVPVYPQTQFYAQQADNMDAFGQGQVNLAEPTIITAFESGHNQPQPSHVEFDANGDFNVANLTDQEFSDLITPTSMGRNLAYDSVRQVFYLQPQESQASAGASAPGFDFTGEPFGGQPWNFG